MSGVEEVDLLVLGSGEAGKFLAWTFAAKGQRAVVVERRYVGGSCPNIACLPSKYVIHAAKVASYVRRGPEFGLPAFEGVADMSAVQARKRAMVDGLVALHREKFQASGAELVLGSGRFVAPKTIEVDLADGGRRTFVGRAVVVCTGSRARLDDIPGLAEARPLTHVEALDLDRLPGHLIVLGGGYVGLELAQAFRRLGSRVTVVERNANLLHREDPDVTAAIADLFRDEGIDVLTGATVGHVAGTSGQVVRLTLRGDGVPASVEGTDLLVAGGRVPNTDGIGLELAGIEVDGAGHVRVDERLRTTAAGVWAVGDCAGSPHFTHIAYDDFRVVRDDLTGGDRVTTGRQVPSCLFTDPELARVGQTEREAARQGVPYRLAKIPMAAVLRTRTLSETRGFLKALIEADGDRILGFTAFGVDAGELLPAIQVTMAAGLPYQTLRDTILTHPTLAEGLGVLFSSVPGDE